MNGIDFGYWLADEHTKRLRGVVTSDGTHHIFYYRIPRITCADGFSMSVQVGEDIYCEPRQNSARIYHSAEVGCPSQEETLLMPWVEDEENPTDTVYGYVPCDTIAKVIEKHGGMVEEQSA